MKAEMVTATCKSCKLATPAVQLQDGTNLATIEFDARSGQAIVVPHTQDCNIFQEKLVLGGGPAAPRINGSSFWLPGQGPN